MKRITLFAALCCLALFAVSADAQKRRVPVKKKPAAPAATPANPSGETAPKDVEFKAVTPADADGWRVYESQEDKFRLAFSGTPVVTDSTDGAGKKDGNRYYNPETVTGVRLALTMTVQWLGAAIDESFKRKIYDAWAEGVLAEQGGQKTTLVTKKEFAVGNSFGLEVVADHGAYRFRGRIVCPVDRCYQYSVGAGTPDALKPEENTEVEKWARKFFDSFQLIK